MYKNKRWEIGGHLSDCKEELIDIKETSEFKTKDGAELPETIYCSKCGSDKLFVGQTSYTVNIKCPICKWEITIAEE